MKVEVSKFNNGNLMVKVVFEPVVTFGKKV